MTHPGAHDDGTAGAPPPGLTDLPIDELSARLLSDLEQAAAVLERLVAEEDRLVLENRMKPYLDKVPRLLGALPEDIAGSILDRLPVPTAKRILFGNYTRIPDLRLTAVLRAMDPRRAASLVDAMAVGVDAPREMARLLSSPGRELDRVAASVQPATLLRLLLELDEGDQIQLIVAAGEAQALALSTAGPADANPAHTAWTGELLAAARRGRDQNQRPAVGRLRELRPLLDGAPIEEVAVALRSLSGSQVGPAVRLMQPARAAGVLEVLAADDPRWAAGLLQAVNTHVLLRPPQAGVAPSWWLHECPAATILPFLDLGLPATFALLEAMAPDQLELILEHAPARTRSSIHDVLSRVSREHVPFSFEIAGIGRGQRRARTLDAGLRWIHIEEELRTERGTKPVLVDLLEVPLDQVRLEARMAVPDGVALPADQAAAVFEQHRLSGQRPSGEAFASMGLTQLSWAVDRSGALAAINGNFYFDYGHYLNGVTLGIDVANVPGLFFGDPIGWFVNGGHELIPPAFNRAAGVVTADGTFHIGRVFMTDVVLPNGRLVRWAALNQPKAPGRTSAYNSVFGYRTEAGPSHVDVAIARGRVWAVNPGGAQVIPLTGFVLSVPREDAGEVLGPLRAGDGVVVGHDFPPAFGPVVEAMACGPSLVRSGALDVDFAAEDFGQQDSTVMSFFLPRTVETYEAARAFIALRDRTLILGTVSGTAYGFGRSTASEGMTFGELAQLCLDVGADHAYALDGGGSSSLVARKDGAIRLLNSPTGGADVGQGEERYINTYWLVFERNGRSEE